MEDKTHAGRSQVPAGPWDSATHMAPDPSWPIEHRLRWYEVSSRILLNCSEVVRRKAAAAGDREACDAEVQTVPLCPNGCGCRLGTSDADARDCACDGLCCYDEIEISELFAERDRLRDRVAVLLAVLLEIGEGDPVHGMAVRAALVAAGTGEGQ
jgi:hypothetical protein